MTKIDVISLEMKSPIQLVDFTMTDTGVGHMIVETDNEADAFRLLFCFEDAHVA